MIDDEALYQYGYGHEGIFAEMEMSIMEDIVRRIRDAGQITRSADFQIWQLYRMGWSSEEIKDQIQRTMQASDTYIDGLYEKALKEDYISTKELYEATQTPRVAFSENLWLKQLITQMTEQTKEGTHTLSQSLGFVVKEGAKTEAKDLTSFYNRAIDRAITDIHMGAFDVNTVLRRTVKEMTNSGLRWIDYESGTHNRVTVAARRAVMTGLAQVSQQLTQQTAKDLGTDTFEVSAHAGARPEHAEWQGGVYKSAELESICGLGHVTGLLGANCYHTYHPFIPGLSTRAYTDEQLEQWHNPEADIEFGGRKYTPYEAKQQMRRMETTMRAERQKIHLLKEGGGNKADIEAVQAKYRMNMEGYKKLCETANMKPQFSRIYMDGFSKMSGTDPIKGSLLRSDIAGGNKVRITDVAIAKANNVKLKGFEEYTAVLGQKSSELLRYARDFNNSNEVMEIVRVRDLPKLQEDEKSVQPLRVKGTEWGVDPSISPEACDVISRSGERSLIFMHNHTHTNEFSLSDLTVFRDPWVQALTMTTNKGKVRALNKLSNYSAEKCDKIFMEEGKKLVGTNDSRLLQKNILKRLKEAGVQYI